MGRSAQHTVEGELCSLLAQLVGQVGDLTAQIIDVHAVEGRQTLLCSGQLRLQALYSGLMGGCVQTMQPHHCVDLLLGQALDGFQILTFHGLPPIGPTALLSRCRARALCTSLTPGARCNLVLSYHTPAGKNVMT